MIHDKFIPPTSITFKGISPHQLIPLLRDFHLHLPPSARPEGNLWIQQETQQGQHQPTSLVAAKRAIRAVMTTRAKSQQRAWRSIKCPTLSTVNPNPHHICVLFARPLHGSPERKDTLWNVPRLLACAASPWNWPFPPFKPILSQELHAVVRGQDLRMAATRLIVSRVWQWTSWLTPYRYFAYVHVYVNIYIYTSFIILFEFLFALLPLICVQNMLTALCQSRQLSSLGTCKGSHLSSTTDRKPAGGNDSAELELWQTPTKESKKFNQRPNNRTNKTQNLFVKLRGICLRSNRLDGLKSMPWNRSGTIGTECQGGCSYSSADMWHVWHVSFCLVRFLCSWSIHCSIIRYKHGTYTYITFICVQIYRKLEVPDARVYF